jgi:hypothetical protein
MKIFLTLLLFISFNAMASDLETFFSKLEGSWDKITAESQRETPQGGLTHSNATKFAAKVTRQGNSWGFVEDMCWQEDGSAPECGAAALSYVIENDELSIVLDNQTYPVTILEVAEDFLMITLSTGDYDFTAVLMMMDDQTLSQQSVMELHDGTKEYQILNLRKQ